MPGSSAGSRHRRLRRAGCEWVFLAWSSPSRYRRQRDRERRPVAGMAPHPDGGAMAAGDLAADGQAHATAFILVAPVQALKGPEDAFCVGGIEADAIVGTGELPAVADARGGDG